MAEMVVDQAITTAYDEAYINSEEHREQHKIFDASIGTNSGTPCHHVPYPPAELEHLATVTFNQALDFYKEEKDGDCRRWTQKAIRLAELMGSDEGERLAGMFRDRLKRLF